jgi:hypothetical protein
MPLIRVDAIEGRSKELAELLLGVFRASASLIRLVVKSSN